MRWDLLIKRYRTNGNNKKKNTKLMIKHRRGKDKKKNEINDGNS